jgi:hypothetical protein
MGNADHIITALGGTKRVADALSLPMTTVSSWKTAKAGIPSWRHKDIRALAKRLKVDLSTPVGR